MKSQGGEEYHTQNKKKEDNWIGQILRRSCLLNYIIEGKVDGKIGVTGRQRKRLKQLLDDPKVTKEYCKLK